jgi:TRAP-type C4-dicarboxylate transport system permease small subunit
LLNHEDLARLCFVATILLGGGTIEKSRYL